MAKKKLDPKVSALHNLAGNDPDNENFDPEFFIPSGHPDLDYYVSRGKYEDEHGNIIADRDDIKYGIPSGVISMFYGGEAGGKSSLAYRVCGNAQRMGLVPFWIDAENSFSEQLARINGLDPDPSKMVVQRLYDLEDKDNVFHAEAVIDRMIDACKKGAGVVVLDSVAGLIPKYAMENESDKEHVALLARVLGRTLNKVANYAKANEVAIIFINQKRTKPGQMYGNPEGTTGGHALMHFASLVLKIDKVNSKDAYHYIEDEDGDEALVSGTSRVRIEKNRFAAPHMKPVEIPVYYRYFFPDVEDVIFDYGRKTKVISKRLKVFSWNGIKVEGKDNFIEQIKKDDKILDLVSAIRASVEGKNIALPTEIINFEKHVAFKDKNEVKRGEEHHNADFDPEVDAPKRKANKPKKAPKLEDNLDI